MAGAGHEVEEGLLIGPHGEQIHEDIPETVAHGDPGRDEVSKEMYALLGEIVVEADHADVRKPRDIYTDCHYEKGSHNLELLGDLLVLWPSVRFLGLQLTGVVSSQRDIHYANKGDDIHC